MRERDLEARTYVLPARLSGLPTCGILLTLGAGELPHGGWDLIHYPVRTGILVWMLLR